MHAQKVIEMLGYSAKEAKVYLAMLSLGECHISDLAEKADMPRSSAQVIVDKLHKDGLANFYIMRRYKYWIAENPKRFLEMLKKREKLIEEEIPYLLAIRNKRRGKRYIHEREEMPAFKLLADAIKQPVLVTDDKIRIEYVNRPWEAQFGYELKEVAGKNPRILQSGKTPDEIYREGWKALEAGKMYQTDKVIDRKKNGMDFALRMTVFPIISGGRVYYLQIVDPRT